MEDDIVNTYAISLLEEAYEAGSIGELCPKKMQISLTGFLEENTSVFMEELWKLLLSAQKEVTGIPKELVREKQDERERIIE